MSADMEDLMSIGRFAAVSRLSPKALRLYAENGLLPPAWIDPGSGYRYYRHEQLRAASLIALLRRAGVPLVEIRTFLADPTVDLLKGYERRATDELAERRRVLRIAKRLIRREEAMDDVVTKRVQEQPYVSRSKRVLVGELESYIRSTFADLGGDEPGDAPPFVLYHGPVNTEEDGPVEACVPARDGDKRLPGGEVAFTAIAGDECEFPAILAAYESVYRWSKEHGRQAAGPPREIYVGGPDDHRRMEIALPLR